MGETTDFSLIVFRGGYRPCWSDSMRLTEKENVSRNEDRVDLKPGRPFPRPVCRTGLSVESPGPSGGV